MEYKKVKAILKVVVEAEFSDNESNADTLRYLVEQDLEDNGYDVEVNIIE